jgi:spermidine/putrescine transport system ATP-binding protein
MNSGHILQLGTARDIYETPSTRFVADFIGESNFLDGTVAGWADGYAAITIPGAGAIQARATNPIAPGAQATTAIRPERISIEPAAAHDTEPGENRLTGRLLEAVYAGSSLHYAVMLGSDVRIAVRSPNTGQVVGVGEAVTLRWPAANCTVLTA